MCLNFRFEQANKAAAKLISSGQHVFSPISHTHPISQIQELPSGWEHWKAYDEAMLSKCSKLIVLTLDGWMESVGVNAEIEFATLNGIEIEYMEPVE